MYIQYEDGLGETVRNFQLSNLSFSSSIDHTMNSLPVDEFSVDMVTNNDFEIGQSVMLYDDQDRLYASFYVKNTQWIDKRVLRVNAMSPLGFLDEWTEPAKRIANTSLSTVLRDMLSEGHLTKEGLSRPVKWSTSGSGNINGFGPEQLARERLLWACVASGHYVQQSFCDGLVFASIKNFSQGYTHNGTLIPKEIIYNKPNVKKRELIYKVKIEEVTGITQSSAADRDHSGTADDGTVYYWNTIIDSYTREDNKGGKFITYTGNSLIGTTSLSVERLAMLCMLPFEIHAEIYGDVWNYPPGKEVRIYVDDDTVYNGIIQSADYSFGQQTKARLTIIADSVPIELHTVKIQREYISPETGNKKITLGGKTYKLPNGTYDFEHHDVYVDTVGSLMLLSPLFKNNDSMYINKDIEIIVPYRKSDSEIFYEEYWDLTKSFVGELHGIKISSGGVNITANGAVFDSTRQFLIIPVYKNYGIDVEIQIKTMDITGTSRVLIGSDDHRSGLIYSSTSAGWVFNYGSSGGDESLGITDGSFFNGSTLKVHINGRYRWSFYKDDVLLYESSRMCSVHNYLLIGCRVNSYYTSIDNAVISSIKINIEE